ncbi:MAG: hypothetical protein WBB96_11890 [Candidatus Dechloromonas phosphoritropha]|nr:hypothetical protein [Candidatus Dechloromonas phosphoritropha]MBP8789242.1 hypothetical protein [Azonexus sp.]MBP9229430.1 hypothetical protein [Azonexus sp.]
MTADIEFDIRGALTYPDRCSPAGFESVQRKVGGRSQGLAPLLRPLSEFGLPATFFVEAMQVAHFGTEPMASVVNELKQYPLFDLQLHAHPCWEYLLAPDWRQTVGQVVKNDSLAGRGVGGATRILSLAADYFRHLTGQSPVAFRPGNLRIDGDLLRAQAAVGLPLSSSGGKAYFVPEDPSLSLWSGVARQDSVTEIPVTSYQVGVPWKNLAKLLTVTGTPLSTMIRILEHAAKHNQGPVVFLTHASEMAKDAASIFEPPRYVPLRTNQERWRELCCYLHENAARFRVLPFGPSVAFWQSLAPVSRNPYRGRVRDLSVIALSRLIKRV